MKMKKTQSKGLSERRTNTVINETSKKQDKTIIISRDNVIAELVKMYPEITFVVKKKIYLKDIVEQVKLNTGNNNFFCELDSTYITPDGQFLYAVKDGVENLILISERKNQGTNDRRIRDGLKKQSMGNACERLAKNIRGVEMLMLPEDIFPFVTFLDGCDFKEGSTIRDRIVTMGQFFPLNTTYVKKLSLLSTKISRGSFYVRNDEWTIDEMSSILLDVCIQSIEYYKEIGKL
jgi:type II restriction enzyme